MEQNTKLLLVVTILSIAICIIAAYFGITIKSI